MQTNKKGLQTIVYLLIVTLIGIGIYFFNVHMRESIMNMDFNGVVSKVWYDDKDYAHVVVNGEEYALEHTIWDHNIKILKGDVVIKLKGSLIITLIRASTKDTISASNNYHGN